jgi:hypothetical protein
MFMEESSKVPTRDSMNSGFGYDPIDPENIVPLNHDSSVDIVYSTFILGVGVPLGLAMNRLHQHHFMLRPTSILKTWTIKGLPNKHIGKDSYLFFSDVVGIVGGVTLVSNAASFCTDHLINKMAVTENLEKHYIPNFRTQFLVLAMLTIILNKNESN